MKTEFDPNLVFVGFPQYSDTVSRKMRDLMTLLGDRIGKYTFIPFEAQSFSAAKSRNIIVAAMRKTKAGKLLLIDSDMNATQPHVERILSHAHRVIGALYPKKTLRAEGPEWVVNFDKTHKKDANGVSGCIDVGAGFLKIDRDVIEAFISSKMADPYYSDDRDTWGQVQHEVFNEGVESAVWGPGADPWERRLGEDFRFCYLCRVLGIPVHVDCACQVGHVGEVDFLQVYALIERAVVAAQEGALPARSDIEREKPERD